MRYIGGKSLLLDDILELIKNNTDNVKSVIDIFSGSGIVSKEFKQEGYKVISNDFLYFSYILNRGTLDLNEQPKFSNLEIIDPIEYLNNLKLENTDIDIKDCFIYQNYSPNENCNRMYFQNENAKKIDVIRITIEKWYKDNKITEDEYYYLLASLISAIPYVSNITGVYGAYLKHWDKRTFNSLELKKPDIISREKCVSYNADVNHILKNISADLLYADPPYNQRQYLPNYHILETVAKYDYPEISGVTGMRNYDNQKSEFCQKRKVKEAFKKMIEDANVKYVVISYNNEGLLSTEELMEICKLYAKKDTFKLVELDYRRYKSKIPNNKKGLCEQLYFFEKKNITKRAVINKNIYDKSPLNYIGGKYKMLPKLFDLFPKEINIFVDLFCGGCDVGANINAKQIYCNDINKYVIQIFKEFQNKSIDELLSYIESTIQENHLSMTNKDAYLNFRSYYNKTKKPLDLYILVCYSFNYQFRFNSKHEYNNPFGKDRSSFNSTMKENLIKFHSNIKNICFESKNFKDYDISHLGNGDFVYADPPYLITTGSYNDGKRGFEGWSESDDYELFKMLDKLNDQGVKFALSNVIEHKGKQNLQLIEWKSKYNTHYMDYNYNNSNYQSKNKNKTTKEVLITNY